MTDSVKESFQGCAELWGKEKLEYMKVGEADIKIYELLEACVDD